MMTFSLSWKICLVEQPMIISHGGKLNLTSTIPLAPAELAMVIGYINLHWFLLIILEFPLLHQKPISHRLYALANWLQTPSAWRVRSWTHSRFGFFFSSYMKRFANFTADSISESDRLPSLSAQPLGHEFGYWECDIYFFKIIRPMVR